MFILDNLTKIYHHRSEPVYALDSVQLTIPDGSFTAVTGGSGSGKTTLLLMLGGLIRPTSGTASYNGADLCGLSANQLAEYRNRTVGFVLQTFNLVPYLTALENVMVPMLLNGTVAAERRNRAMALLEQLDLDRRIDFFPRELSIGQQQRVAIARAMANKPEVILADEPTGNLDPSLSVEILDILEGLNRKDGRTVVMVTHNPLAAQRAQTVLQLSAGRILSEEAVSPTGVATAPQASRGTDKSN